MSSFIARWDTEGGHHVELMKNGDWYYCNTSLGRRYLDIHAFENDDDAIWYVDRRVKEGNFDPPPLVWRRV